MSALNRLGENFGTDKAWHGYLDIYAPYLAGIRYRAERIMEIGVASGASIRMWRRFFPTAEIVGVDHNPECKAIADAADKIRIIIRDVRGEVLWHELRGETFDLIVDDGGHYSDMIIAAFKGGWPLLKSGGLYIVEDLHFLFPQEIEVSSGKTAFDFFQQKVFEMNEGGANQCGRPTTSDIAFIHFYKSLVILKKR